MSSFSHAASNAGYHTEGRWNDILTLGGRDGSMTMFELLYRSVRPFDHPLYQRVFRILRDLQRSTDSGFRVLDVGGRRSNYTIGLTGQVLITDVPRETSQQHQLDLGATEEVRRKVLTRRSNVEDYLIDDMTSTTLPEKSFDVAVAVEVLEHVDDDETFVRNVARVLKPNGWFVMTTPNGDFLRIPYPDHRRHYQRDHLVQLLTRYFSNVDVQYAVNAGRLIRWGVHRPTMRSPFRTLLSPTALFLCDRLEASGLGGIGPNGKRHLVALAQVRQNPQ